MYAFNSATFFFYYIIFRLTKFLKPPKWFPLRFLRKNLFLFFWQRNLSANFGDFYFLFDQN